MAYKKPILIEIFCELALGPGKFDETKFFDLVPRLKKNGLDQIEFAKQQQLFLTAVPVLPAELLPEQGALPRVRCWSRDRKRLVQLAGDLIVINQVGDYLGWDAFRALFDQTLDAYRESIGTPSVVALSLNTIDRMRVPEKEFSVGRYLNCGSEKVPSWFADARESCDIVLGRGVLAEDRFNRQLQIRVRRTKEAFQIDINSVFHDAIDATTPISKRLDQLHEESSSSFRNLITPTTENEVMGGSK